MLIKIVQNETNLYKISNTTQVVEEYDKVLNNFLLSNTFIESYTYWWETLQEITIDKDVSEGLIWEIILKGKLQNFDAVVINVNESVK